MSGTYRIDQDPFEQAWKLVLTTDKTPADIARTTPVSKATASRQMAYKDHLKASGIDVMRITWGQALELFKELPRPKESRLKRLTVDHPAHRRDEEAFAIMKEYIASGKLVVGTRLKNFKEIGAELGLGVPKVRALLLAVNPLLPTALKVKSPGLVEEIRNILGHMSKVASDSPACP